MSPSKIDSPLEYEDKYSTAKFICICQQSPDNKDAILKQFNAVADAFISLKHPNIAQIFGICKLTIFPAIVFHGDGAGPFRILFGLTSMYR
ncbi:hypothetical protein ARMGADRAFT_56297 [Armillaria gallica]|uniref:Serine-threonine/tyrosine-protein kinase catalytic domain-containing protein n=1 Tax=Armillaria gallica TaxID=47427 RepID=A0A2H3EEW6_ARMGA|nr:hypothetical protein ARMGADRAFT_56297 [Armillaria gallica]